MKLIGGPMRLHRVVIFLFAATLAFAQTPASPSPSADAPSKEQILKLIDLLRVRDQMKEVLGQLREQVHTGALQNLRARVSKPTPEQIVAVNTIVDEQLDDMQRKYSLDQMIEDTAPVYQRHLTRADLEAMVGFYSSPSGQKMLNERPAMMQETMQAASSKIQPIVEAALDNVDKRIQEITAGGDSNDPDRPPLKKKPAATTTKPPATPKK
jgi:hypothetical protein